MSKSKMAKRTVEDIKNGLNLLATTDVSKYAAAVKNGLPYDYKEDIAVDALSYIQQLEARECDLFDLLSSAWFGKRYYFRQDNGTIYSRASGEYLTFDQAIDEFAGKLTNGYKSDPKARVSKWTSVEKRKPKRGEHVLFLYAKDAQNPVMHDKNPMVVGRYDYGMCLANGCEVKVTHWMPLPEPPAEVNL